MKTSIVNATIGLLLQVSISFCQVSLQYSDYRIPSVNLPNERSATSVVGWGWRYGVSTITVAHNNTVDINDDRWYFNSGMGNMSEIVRKPLDRDESYWYFGTGSGNTLW